ncbi:MAG: hypothetical protein AAF569_04060 [Pseudomonadota bacterium]
MKISKFINQYWIFLLLISLVAWVKISHIFIYANTFGITVSKNYESLVCDESIEPINSLSIDTFLKKDRHNYKTNFKTDICTMDKIFDGSDTDRSILFSYSDNIYEFWTVGRWDIAQYFYRKIIESNPDDALSEYIKREKLKDKV